MTHPTNHTELLNYLLQKCGGKRYLEIGINNPNANFNKIKCDSKVGIDPDPQSGATYLWTSDFFFSNQDGREFDVIFIDGYHEAQQVKRDFENSQRCLNDGGFIVIHDTLPENEAGTIVPRETRQWWGDVYKWAMTLSSYDGIGFVTCDMDNGCTIVWKDETAKGDLIVDAELGWREYAAVKSKYLRIVPHTHLSLHLPTREAVK